LVASKNRKQSFQHVSPIRKKKVVTPFSIIENSFSCFFVQTNKKISPVGIGKAPHSFAEKPLLKLTIGILSCLAQKSAVYT
jgi:hypothetical protein